MTIKSEIMLVTADGGRETISRDESKQSRLITEMIRTLGMDDSTESMEIPLENSGITHETLKKVVEWTRKFAAPRSRVDSPDGSGSSNRGPEERLVAQWEIDFMNSLDSQQLYEVITAANFLQHDSLLDGCTTCIAHILRGKTAEEIRDLTGLTNDFTPEEYERVMKENVWLGD